MKDSVKKCFQCRKELSGKFVIQHYITEEDIFLRFCNLYCQEKFIESRLARVKRPTQIKNQAILF